ncbi:sensor histidine kinase [Sinorhizobium mexicanum]|nr:ATP-binding protein [Sinorhizobium mexicanum]MBP1886054.1 C4-dicarboxylate-specific signal transduction histidine kinase [Sinorhizobium mexicanum]
MNASTDVRLSSARPDELIGDTEQRRIELQLRQIGTDFAHAARVSALGELVTSIAHEVRQPLSVIVTDADTASRWLGRTDPNLAKVQQLVSRIKENALRANRVIQRIKDMAVRSDPVRQAIDINDIVKEAVLFIKAETEAHSISLRLQLAEELPSITGDRVQLQQVAVNLLINSIQAITQTATEDREIVVDTSQAEGETVSLTIRDTGGGIPAAALERVFEGFFSTKPDGMGMGLAICRSIITDHGGMIRAANCEPHGALFRVLLPASAPAEA